jgi:hypothetical protein
MQLHFFEEAVQEVEEHRAWYRERSESAEAGFMGELDHAVGSAEPHASKPKI